MGGGGEGNKHTYDDLLVPKKEKISKYFAFDPSKLSGGKLFATVLLLTLGSRGPNGAK